MKKFAKNILYFLEINAALFICHILALFGVAFNDSGEQFENIFEGMHVILFGVLPLIIGSIIMINIFKKKKDFLIYQFLILQIPIIICWGIFYIINYVPNSAINRYIQTQKYERIMNSQIQENEKIIKELKNGYAIYDSIKNDEQKVTLYFNKNNKKVIIEFEINNNVNYLIVDTIKNDDIPDIEIFKNNSDYKIQIDSQNQLSIVLDTEKYGIYKEKMLEGWYAPMKYTESLYIENQYYNPINVYKEMVEESILKGENIYYIREYAEKTIK